MPTDNAPKVINSFYPDTYIDIGLNDRRLAGWNPARNPRSAPRLQARVIGAEMCAWADVEYYPRALPSAIPFFADRVWNKAPVRDLTHFAASLARQLFGPQASPELSRVFEYLGSIIPRPEKMGRFGEASAGALEIAHGKTMADYQRFVRIVRCELRVGCCSNRPVLEEYLASLQDAPLAD